ncbi:glycerol uptake facilitator protein GlpF [Psychroflexus torquis ATCC 700755]|uniref:Glycerol uptake facilitator protein GlpF n=1 Tax=Psychroflexus torquis (strain ATCC 700755 / CIP 106069 / ACAM 623) TaxID=313595 RepID=K4IHW3_PSYTT|nr:MIP/aquaporin family protein [Psychroflexus torquis]AFU68656.1 glycerol uptake facilitator protein GlpF [Psychroflexus torquis ATCC 700755]
MTPFIAEILGTAILILLGGGVVASCVLKETKSSGSGWIVITTGWAMAVFIGVLVAAPYSGAHINPAVTLALALEGSFPWKEVPVYILAQLIGAMIGSGTVYALFKDHFDASDDAAGKRAIFCTDPAISNTFRNLLSEIVGTFVLIIAVFYISGAELHGENSAPVGLGSVGAIPIAFVVWSIGLSLGGLTGYAINPARDLGPRIMHFLLPIKGKTHSNWSYGWIPVIGPFIGAVLATLLHLMLS